MFMFMLRSIHTLPEPSQQFAPALAYWRQRKFQIKIIPRQYECQYKNANSLALLLAWNQCSMFPDFASDNTEGKPVS